MKQSMFDADHIAHKSALDYCEWLNHEIAWSDYDITGEMLWDFMREFKEKFNNYSLHYSRSCNYFYIEKIKAVI